MWASRRLVTVHARGVLQLDENENIQKLLRQKGDDLEAANNSVNALKHELAVKNSECAKARAEADAKEVQLSQALAQKDDTDRKLEMLRKPLEEAKVGVAAGAMWIRPRPCNSRHVLAIDTERPGACSRASRRAAGRSS